MPRYLVVGGAGSHEVAPGVKLFDTPDFPAIYLGEAKAGGAFLDKLKAEPVLNWTFLSPSALFSMARATAPSASAATVCWWRRTATAPSPSPTMPSRWRTRPRRRATPARASPSATEGVMTIRLHYIHDPLCGWCYAAAPLAEAAAAVPGVEIVLHGGRAISGARPTRPGHGEPTSARRTPASRR